MKSSGRSSSNRSGPAAMDTSRRVFRGRGGATDRRLPKHSARRRKKLPDELRSDKHDSDEVATEPARPLEEFCREPVDDASCEEATEDVCQKNSESENKSSEEAEIRHLMARIGRVRKAIQMSSSSLVRSPSTWKQNVLDAVHNCVREWKAIVDHYQDLQESIAKHPAGAIFELIQISLQCGPLTGGKPGYFKRCGSDVANTALQFLNATIPNKHDSIWLRFTEKQAEAIELWRTNAANASQSNKPPSKSVVKKQQSGRKK